MKSDSCQSSFGRGGEGEGRGEEGGGEEGGGGRREEGEEGWVRYSQTACHLRIE